MVVLIATKFKYKPGVVMGGKRVIHDCGDCRSIGYFLEPVIVLGLFGKKPLEIRLKGITNDSKDPSVDTFRSTTLPILKQFGVPSEGLDLKIVSRGGEVVLSIPVLKSLSAVTWIDEGMVKRIRGWAFSANVSPQFEFSMIYSARGIFNNLLPDVFIFHDHKSGAEAGNSPGYGISLVAETNAGCCISADTTISYGCRDDVGDIDDEKKELRPADDVGEDVASALLEEIEQGGVVDSTHRITSLRITKHFGIKITNPSLHSLPYYP
ncbi:Probable RNA 3'-terminal phosphate cyclase-like protein [Linum grandiflorum]